MRIWDLISYGPDSTWPQHRMADLHACPAICRQQFVMPVATVSDATDSIVSPGVIDIRR